MDEQASDGLVWQSMAAEDWALVRVPHDAVVEMGWRQVEDEGPLAHRDIWQTEAIRVYRAAKPNQVLRWEWNGGAERTIVEGAVTAGIWDNLKPLLPLLHKVARGGRPTGGVIDNGDPAAGDEAVVRAIVAVMRRGARPTQENVATELGVEKTTLGRKVSGRWPEFLRVSAAKYREAPHKLKYAWGTRNAPGEKSAD